MSIHQEGVLSRGRIVSLGASLAVFGMLLLPGHSTAQTVTLSDAGSTATIDQGSSAGMNSWLVNGQNQLNQQWFWYRTTAGGVPQPINTIANPNVLNGGLIVQQLLGNQVEAYYYNDQLSVDIIYTLLGGGVGSGSADITERVVIVNQSSSQMDNFNFYQYSNFNLLGAANDNVEIFGGSGVYNYIRQWNGSTAIQEAVTAPSANYAETGFNGQTLYALNNTPGLNLTGPLTSGPGNVTWALQWSASLDANGGEFDLTKDKVLSISVVPEPGTATLVVLGGLCLAGWTVRRRLS